MVVLLLDTVWKGHWQRYTIIFKSNTSTVVDLTLICEIDSFQHILSEPEEILTVTGQRLPMRLQIAYISFSAHTDYRQTSEFIRILKPPHVVSDCCLSNKQNNVFLTIVLLKVLVHGEMNEMSRLKAAIIREYEDDPEVRIEVYNPRNTVAVDLHFRGEKTAKV